MIKFNKNFTLKNKIKKKLICSIRKIQKRIKSNFLMQDHDFPCPSSIYS
jgi:hypothetical protein